MWRYPFEKINSLRWTLKLCTCNRSTFLLLIKVQTIYYSLKSLINSKGRGTWKYQNRRGTFPYIWITNYRLTFPMGSSKCNHTVYTFLELTFHLACFWDTSMLPLSHSFFIAKLIPYCMNIVQLIYPSLFLMCIAFSAFWLLKLKLIWTCLFVCRGFHFFWVNTYEWKWWIIL